jgi:hypothetical protein
LERERRRRRRRRRTGYTKKCTAFVRGSKENPDPGQDGKKNILTRVRIG